MEVIKISTEKLMVTLTDTDMEKYAISCDRLESGNTSSREALRRILEDAKVGDGFCTESARVLVQVFPSKKGGCEMFVTKLGDGGGISDTGRYSETRQHSLRAVYSFDSLENMLRACRAAHTSGYEGGSSAYAEDGRRKYYLTLDDEYPNMSEFGGKRCRSSAFIYIDEHCRIISRDAVKQFSAFA